MTFIYKWMSCFLLFFSLDYCLYETLSSWERLSLHFTSYSPLFLFRNAVFCAITVLYTDPSLVSSNHLGSNKCSVDNNFISLVNVLFPIALQFRPLSAWSIIQLRMSILTLHVVFLLVPIQKIRVLCDNCLVYCTSLVSNNYLGSNKSSVENAFHLQVNVLFPIALQFRPQSAWSIIQLRMSILTLHVVFLLVPIQKIRVLCDNSLVYSISLVSNNYLGSNKSSVENAFHLQVNVLFPIVLQFRLLSVWNIIQLRTSIFTLHVIFPLVTIQKSRALCDYCLVYSTSQVSNNYLGSNNCSVDNNFHLLVNVLFPIALQFRLLSVCNIIQLRMSIFTLHFVFSLFLCKSCALCDNCLVYITPLVSNNYPGSNKSSVENDFHLQVNVLFPIVLQFRLLSVWNIIQLRTSIFYTSHHFPPCSSSEKLCFAR